ncbi:TPA: ATP-binding cassette domain-containing protein [Escherichia coli]|uniref:ABC transporter permease n=1 Tax=Escherichia coli TaxID=562 RepID=UPI0015D6E61E|nr:ABC transporter permease [Escherichia coli]MED8142870.1 ATP-binding cassette domain-containing protein [Escherichia coli]NZD29002.1 ATP-binding cassette domain-containing protein [Escherichia coli]HCO5960985.1 ATP-binding cassette domain-containing protein [Escherichia coli]HCO6110605.1 ATP-binding cassette domain-containing protein [Escherichia coli]HCO6397553.1 ATP-binding cassette domain-containing protein [Escherichia coli]
MTFEPVIKLSKINYYYKTATTTHKVLTDFSLSIDKGEFVVIVGKSGAGKTSLLNVIGCLDIPQSGMVNIQGFDIKSLSSDQLSSVRGKNIGFIFQRYHLMSNLTVFENIIIPTLYSDRDFEEVKERVDKITSLLDINDKLHWHPSQLSGGQQQRVCIARALINDAEVIIADEPTGALDEINSGELIKILRELNGSGKTIIMVTHDINIAKNVATRLIKLEKGVITYDKKNTPVEKKYNQKDFSLPHYSKKSNGKLTKNLLRISLRSLLSNFLRSFLTMIGIIIGISSVIICASIGEGSKQQVLENISNLGKSVVEIKNLNNQGEYNIKTHKNLSLTDVEYLKRYPWIAQATPVAYGSDYVSYSDKKMPAEITAVYPDFFSVRGISLLKGRLFLKSDVDYSLPIVIIDVDMERELFSTNGSAIGQYIYISGIPLKVIGVAKLPGISNNSNQFKLWLPYSTYISRVAGYRQPDSIYISFKTEENHEDNVRYTINVLTQAHGRKDFTIWSDQSLSKTLRETSDSLSLLITLIASISLIVGGIGLMNVMLSSVNERIYEIGIRKAVGARSKDIVLQFILETTLICIIGGGIAIFISLGTQYIIPYLYDSVRMVTSVTIIFLSCFFSILIGLCAGVFPAVKASRIHPSLALVKQ